MTSNTFSYIHLTLILTCCVLLSSKTFGGSKIPKSSVKTAAQIVDSSQANANMFIQRLCHDKLIDETKGFSIVRSKNSLYINGALQTAAVAATYLPLLKQDEFRVDVYPFMDRMLMHPGAGLLQIAAPTTFSSPCVKYSGKKPGC